MTAGDRPRGGQLLIQDPRLAAELRRLRARYQQTGDEVAAKLKWSPSKVSRIERGRHGVRRSELIEYLRACRVPEHEGRAVLALADTLATRPAEFPGEHFAPAVRADAVLDWAPVMVPWLLQTQDYTEALLASRQDVARWSPGERVTYAEAVLAWQARLAESTSLRAVISEAALYQLVGSARVMRAQLEKLARPGGPDIEVRILPQDRAQVTGYAPFTYLEFASMAGVGGTPRVMAYQLDTAVEIGSDKLVWQHKLVFEQLWRDADLPAQAVKQALADAWEG
jgi:transcriptional regulator with XRE-family HTH domain